MKSFLFLKTRVIRWTPKTIDLYNITMLSWETFTSVLIERLNKYDDAVELLLQNQAGFQKNYSTCDHIFTLHILSELFKGTKKKLY